MRSSIRLLIGLLAVSLPATANAQAWEFVNTVGDQGDKSIWLLDKQSIRKVGEETQFWLQVVSQKRQAGRDRYKSLNRADCEAGSLRELQVSTFLGQSPMGEVPAEGVKFPVPGSILEGVLSAVCGKEELLKVPDVDSFASAVFRSFDRLN